MPPSVVGHCAVLLSTPNKGLSWFAFWNISHKTARNPSATEALLVLIKGMRRLPLLRRGDEGFLWLPNNTDSKAVEPQNEMQCILKKSTGSGNFMTLLLKMPQRLVSKTVMVLCRYHLFPRGRSRGIAPEIATPPKYCLEILVTTSYCGGFRFPF